jgi:4-amino-4-deoxy-L-arabinose transferase-like glycosyltransferase
MKSDLPLERKKALQYDLGAGLLLCSIVFILKIGVLNLPYNWDEMGGYMTPAHWLAQGSLIGVFPGFHPPYIFFGHPPALYLSVAFLFKIFGERIWIAHLFAICFSFLGVYFSYLLATRLTDRMTGIFASLILFFSPLYFAQSGMVHADLFVTSLGVMCVYFFFQRRYLTYLLCGTCLVMVKESGAAIIFAIMIYSYLADRDDPRRKTVLLKYSVPLIVLCLFFILQKITTGVFLPNQYFDTNRFFLITGRSITWTFVRQGRIAVTLLTIVAFFLNKHAWKEEFNLFLLISLFFVGTYSFIYCTARYVLPVFPYYCILCAYAIALLFNNVKRQLMVNTAIIVLFIIMTYGAGTGSHGGYDEDMQYVDVVLNHKDACNYVEKAFPGKAVLAEWPLNEALRFPFLGYVSKPLRVVTVKEPYDVVVYTRQGHPDNEKLRTLKKLRLDRVFERNGKHVEIYVTNSSTDQ